MITRLACSKRDGSLHVPKMGARSIWKHQQISSAQVTINFTFKEVDSRAIPFVSIAIPKRGGEGVLVKIPEKGIGSLAVSSERYVWI